MTVTFRNVYEYVLETSTKRVLVWKHVSLDKWFASVQSGAKRDEQTTFQGTLEECFTWVVNG